MLRKELRALTGRGVWWAVLSVVLALTACDDAPNTGGQETCVGVACLDVKGTDTNGGFDTLTTSPDTGGNPGDTFQPACSPGEAICNGTGSVLVCQNGLYEERFCLGTEVCVGNQCQEPVCTPGLAFACETSGEATDKIRICDTDGVNYTVGDCPTGQKCFQGACGDQTCNAREERCDPNDINKRERCNDVGTGWEFFEDCEPINGKETICSEAQCRDLCTLNSKTASFLGCEYYVVDLDNIQADGGTGIPTDDRPFGITVSNPDLFDRIARVRVVGGSCNSDANCPGLGACSGGVCSVTEEVPALGLKVIELNPLSDVDASGIHTNATFKVDSSIPVTVHQFNPLNGVGVFSNDASLLLPVNALGKDYISLINTPAEAVDDFGKIFNGVPASCTNNGQCGAGRSCGSEGYCIVTCSNEFTCDNLCVGCDVLECSASTGRCTLPPSENTYTDIIGITNNTTVTVTSPVDIPAVNITAGTPANFTLNAGELLHLLSVNASGVHVSTDNTVAAFAGNVCAQVPNGTAYCDHIEQQLFPTATWGTTFVAAKSFPRGTEDDHWRIIASTADTIVTLNPGQIDVATDAVITTKTLAAREVLELRATSDFEILASEPVMVGQFWVGSNHPNIPSHPLCSSDNIDEVLYGAGTTCSGSFECIFSLAGDTCDVNKGYCVAACNNDSECQAISGGLTCLGGACSSATGIGDPAYSLAVPTQQYRGDYIVLTPTGYQENYMTLVVPKGKLITMDQQRITATPTLLNDTWDIYRLAVTEGAHIIFIPSGDGFGATAYGYNCDVSYAYPGGLNLLQLN